MQDVLFADMPISEREQHLRDNADQIVEKSYTRKFEQEEINKRRAELANVSIQIRELEDELAEVRTNIKGQIKPLQEQVGKILDELKAGGDWVKGDCFKFVFEDEGMVGFYSPEGHLLEARPMTQEEKQKNVFRMIRETSVEKTGTDN